MEKENKKQLVMEIEELRIRLKEAEETLSAVRSGGVDAIVISGQQGEQVFTLTGAEQAYRVLIETMNEGAASLNQEGVIIYCNHRLSEMLKTPLEKVIGTPMRQFVRAADLPAFDSLIEKGSQKNGKSEVAFIKNDGTGLPVLLSLSTLQKDNANICGITVTDLTAQKYIEDELKKHRDHLEEMVKNRTSELEALNQQLLKEIAERKQQEEKVLKLAKEWQKTFDAIPASVFLLNVEGRITRCNKATEVLLGKTQDEIIGRHCWELMHGTDKPIPECPISSMKKDLKRKSIVIPAEDRWLQIAVDPILNEVGELIGAVHTINDITEHQQAEEALLKSEKEFRLLAESMPQIVWVTRADGWNTYFNQQWLDYTGRTMEESYGHGWNQPFHPDDRQLAWEAWQKATKYGTTYSLECRLRRADGVYKWWLIRGVPVLDEHGTVLKWFGTCTDIDDIKRVADAHRESEERFRQIAESAEEWIWEVDRDGLYTYASPVVEKILGYTPEEIVGIKHFYDFFPFDIREQLKKEVFEGFAAKRQFTKYVNRNAHKNGSIIILETSGSPILDRVGNLMGYRGVDVDITEQKKLEDQLRHAQKMEAVGTLAGGIAHDFNNILNVIMGYGGMVYESLETGSPSKEQMNEVLTAAERAATLTKRLLVFSRKQVVEVKPININELILDLQKMLGRIIRESIDFKLDLADRPLMVLADAGQIEQVLMNLAANARDAMPEGGRLTIGTGLQVLDDEYVAAYGYGKPGRYALITVADSGQGMDEKTKEKIFEPFFTTKGIGEGTGLGLAISYGIIKQHEGYIKVYSEFGKGTEFKIYLPLIEDSAALEMKTAATVSVKGGNETILIAEDDASLRKLSRIVLESYGYTVITAEDGEDAITKFMENRERISLALIDMIMPKKNGKEVGEAIRKVSPNTKILFASGYTMDIIMTKELTECGFDFVLKPVLPRDLLGKVREILDR